MKRYSVHGYGIVRDFDDEREAKVFARKYSEECQITTKVVDNMYNETISEYREYSIWF